jgi:hypothetical protein
VGRGSLLQAITRYCPDDVARTLREVYRHAERHVAFRRYHYGEGEYPSVTAFSIGADEAAAWSIYTGARRSVLSVNLESMRDRGVSTEVLAQLAHALSDLPGWKHVPRQLEAANYAERVSIEPDALGERDSGPCRV